MQNNDITIIVLKILINIILLINLIIFFFTVVLLIIDGEWLSIIVYFILFGVSMMIGYNYKKQLDKDE